VVTTDTDTEDDGSGPGLHAADAHLRTARELTEQVASAGRLARLRSGPALAAAAAAEVAAAVDNVRVEMERNGARVELTNNAIERLELVTAGDEELVDDLGAAIEELQRDVRRLTARLDLLSGGQITERDS